MRQQLDLLAHQTDQDHLSQTSKPSNLILFTSEDLQHCRNIDLYRVTGIHPSYYSAWDRGRSPSVASVNVIANSLGMYPHEVMNGLSLRQSDRIRETIARDKLTALLQAGFPIVQL